MLLQYRISNSVVFREEAVGGMGGGGRKLGQRRRTGREGEGGGVAELSR